MTAFSFHFLYKFTILFLFVNIFYLEAIIIFSIFAPTSAQETAKYTPHAVVVKEDTRTMAGLIRDASKQHQR